MTQQDINQAEWSNPLNWSGPKLLGLYSSKSDTRVWVPKRTPALGWTINVGHGSGKALLVVIIAAVVGSLVVAALLACVALGIAFGLFQH